MIPLIRNVMLRTITHSGDSFTDDSKLIVRLGGQIVRHTRDDKKTKLKRSSAVFTTNKNARFVLQVWNVR